MTDTTRMIEVPFALERDAESDGLDFAGYAAVFNRTAHIVDFEGEYDEVVAPGAFRKTISERMPVFMFNHGKSPLWHNMPIGKITELREDPRGLFVKARLSDNWLIHPIRDAIRDGAVEGMSVRMEVAKHSKEGYGANTLRTIREAKLYELGPVTFPAYTDTTAAIRSLERVEPTIRIAILDGGTTVSANPFDDTEARAEFAQALSDGDLAALRDAEVLDTPEEAAPEEGTSEEAVAPDEPAESHSPLTPAERNAQIREIELKRRGIL